VIAAITTDENVTDCFLWEPSFLQWLGEVISNFGPAFALFGVVWLFFLKRQSDREDEAKRERRKLYREFIAQSQLVLRVPKEADWAEDERIRTFWAIQAEISLIGTDPVIDAAAGFVVSTNDFFMSLEQKIMGRDGVMRTKFANVSHSRDIAIAEMRNELRD